MDPRVRRRVRYVWVLQLLVTLAQLAPALSQLWGAASYNANPISYYSPSVFDPYYYAGPVSASEVKLNDSMPWFKEPLWGVAYVPFRRSTNCSSVTEENIVDDLRGLSRLTRIFYVPEMYCHFGSLIVRTTQRLGKRLVLGLSLKSKDAFDRDYTELEHALKSKLTWIRCRFRFFPSRFRQLQYLARDCHKRRLQRLTATPLRLGLRRRCTETSQEAGTEFDQPSHKRDDNRRL